MRYLIVFLALASCHTMQRPSGPLPLVKMQMPTTTQPFAPVLDTAQQADTSANQTAAVVEQRLQSTTKKLADTRDELKTANKQIQELRTKTGTQEQWDELVASMLAVDHKLEALETEHTATLADLVSEKAYRNIVTGKLVESQKLASAKESEATQLRSQLDYSNSVAGVMQRKAEELASANSLNADKAAKADGIIQTKSITIWRLWVAVICLIIACLVLTKLAIRI